MKVKQLTFGIVLVVTSAIIGLAQADLLETTNDWKGYAGTVCHARSGSIDVRRSGDGRLANFQNTPSTVYCPVVRDVAEGGNNRVMQARVRLFNNNSNVGGFCRLVSRNISGGTFAFDHFAWTPGIKNVTATLGPLNASNWGSYMIYCSIPGVDGARKSFIRSVSLDERD